MIIKRYNCAFSTYVEGRDPCVTCDGMLALGGFAQAVPEARYEDDPVRRLDGLSWRDKERLSAALVDLSYLAEDWAYRSGQLSDVDEATAVTSPCCDGQCWGPSSCEVYGSWRFED